MPNDQDKNIFDFIFAGSVINAYQSALILRQLKGLPDPDEKTREKILEDMIGMHVYAAKKIATGPADRQSPKESSTS